MLYLLYLRIVHVVSGIKEVILMHETVVLRKHFKGLVRIILAGTQKS